MMDGSTFAVSPVLWQGRKLRCVAGPIRGVLFHEEDAECAEWCRCWSESQEVRNLGVLDIVSQQPQYPDAEKRR